MDLHAVRKVILPIFYGMFICFIFCSAKNRENLNVRYRTVSLTQEDVDSLRKMGSPLRIAPEELLEWDNMTREVIKQAPPLQDGDENRLFAYLYNAQKAFAEDSFAITGAYSGSLYPITVFVLQLFYPNFRGIKSAAEDPFSEKLSTLIGKNIEARFKGEQAHIRPISLREQEDNWYHISPFGLRISSMRPWILERVDEFKIPQPPSCVNKFWRNQLMQVKRSVAQVTELRKRQVLFWAGLPTPDALSDWKVIGQEYMSEINVPLRKQLEVRAQLACAIQDVFIVTFFWKYAYLVKRPDMIDPSFKPLIPTPKHPSYPAGHSTVSYAAACILTTHFPENQHEWEKLAMECSMSRIWGGIHFPIDNLAGRALGTTVGVAAVVRR